jgi:hypothetical protein
MIVQQQVPLPRRILRPPSERVDGRPLGGGTDESQFLSVRPVRFRRPFNRGRHGSTLRPPCPQPRHGGQIRFARPRDKLDPASKDFGSKLQTGTADHATAGTDSPKPNGSDKRIGDDLGSHTKKSAKGVSDKTDPDAERTTVHGLHHTATRGSSSSGNEGSADHPIDLRINIHQGREIGKSVKERLFRKPKTALATGTGLNQQHSRDQQSARALHRNAIGAIVGTEKTIKHDFATVGPAAAPVAVTAAVPAIGSARKRLVRLPQSESGRWRGPDERFEPSCSSEWQSSSRQRSPRDRRTERSEHQWNRLGSAGVRHGLDRRFTQDCSRNHQRQQRAPEAPVS